MHSLLRGSGYFTGTDGPAAWPDVAAVRPGQQTLGDPCAGQAVDTFVREPDRRSRALGARCLVVRPGRVRVRTTDEMAPAPLILDPQQVAAVIRGWWPHPLVFTRPDEMHPSGGR